MFYRAEQFKDLFHGEVVYRFIIIGSSLGAQCFLERAVELFFLRRINTFRIVLPPVGIHFFHLPEELYFLRKLRIIQHIEGTLVPLHGFLHISVGAVGILITVAEVAHRNPITLLGCGLKQREGSALVLRQTRSLHEEGTQVVLGFPVAEIRTVLIQFCGSLQILFHAAAMFIQQAQHPASKAVSCLYRLFCPAVAGFIVFFRIVLVLRTGKHHIGSRKFCHGLGIIDLCPGLILCHGLILRGSLLCVGVPCPGGFMHEFGRLFKAVRRAESPCREETDLIQRIRIAFFRKAVHPEVGLFRIRRNFFRFITCDIFIRDITHRLGIAVFRFFQTCFEGRQLHAEGRYEFVFIRTGKLHIADHVSYGQRRAVLSAHPLEGRLIPVAADDDAFPVRVVIRVELRKSEAVTVPLEDRGSAHE